MKIAIFAICLLLLLKDYKRFFIVIFIISTLLENFNLVFEPISEVAFLMSFVFINYKNVFKKGNWPAFLVALALAIPQCITYFMHSAASNQSRLLVNLVCDSGNVIIAWSILKEDVKYVNTTIKTLLIYGAVFGIYTIFEVLTSSNPYIDYIMSHNLYIYRADESISDVRFGVKRCQSIFGMHTTLGGVSLITGYTLFFINRYTSYFKKRKDLIYALSAVLFVCIFLTGARSAIIAIAISLLSFIDIKRIKFYHYIIFGVIALAFGSYIVNYFQEICDSIVDTTVVNGSNADMRETQFAIAAMTMAQSFWTGNGINATSLVRERFPDLLGAESIWISPMIDLGMIGVIGLALMFVFMIFYAIRTKNFKLIFLVLGFLFFGTTSSVPWVYISYTIVYMLIMVSCKHFYPYDSKSHVTEHRNSSL